MLTYQLYQYIAQSEPIEKLVLLEAIEATSDVLVSATQKVVKELRLTTNFEYKYFGDCHFDAESNHNACSQESHLLIENIYISEKTRDKSIYLIDDVFNLFSQWTEELLDYAQSLSSIPSVTFDVRKRPGVRCGITLYIL